MRNHLSFPVAFLIFSGFLISAVVGPFIARCFGSPPYTEPLLARYEAMLGFDTYISPTSYGDAVFEGDAWCDTISVYLHDYTAPSNPNGSMISIGTVGSFPEADSSRRDKWPGTAYWSGDGSVFVVFSHQNGVQMYDFKRHSQQLPDWTRNLDAFIESRGGEGPNLMVGK